jgi:predicted Zn-dependent protease with MMP-like domain
MDRISFEKLVSRALRRLPREFAAKLENISVQIEDAPSQETLREMGITSGTLLGQYHGVPLTERGWGYGNVLPDRIVIYQRPIEEAASSPEDIEKTVAEVVIHEIGHYFGFDDDDLYRIEANKRRKKRRT